VQKPLISYDVILRSLIFDDQDDRFRVKVDLDFMKVAGRAGVSPNWQLHASPLLHHNSSLSQN